MFCPAKFILMGHSARAHLADLISAAHAGALGVRVEVLREALSHKDINQTLGLPGDYTDAVEKFMGSPDPAVRARLARQAGG